MAVITHLKLFMDGGIKQVALFKGDNQAEDWQRNCAATEVLIGNWLELPMEELIPLEQAAARGFIGNTLLNENAADLQLNWQKHCANLHSRIADAAKQDANYEMEAEACTAVAELMVELDDRVRQGAWLLRAVEARLNQWQQGGDGQAIVACELADLFAEFANGEWPGEDDAAAKGAANQRFWLGQAMEKQSQLAIAAEERGDLIAAVSAAEAVIELQNELKSL